MKILALYYTMKNQNAVSMIFIDYAVIILLDFPSENQRNEIIWKNDLE